MKREAKNILTILFMAFITSSTYSQTDSVKVQYSQEKISKESKMDEAICDILTRREKSNKDLWKFNLLRTLLDGFDMAYEKKIAHNWSLAINSVTNMSGLYLYDDHFYASNINSEFHIKENLSFELRYYYNAGRRMRLGKKTGFSGNYMGLGTNGTYNYQVSKYYQSAGYGMNNGRFFRSENFQFAYSLNFLYGLQRKIGRIGYVDVSAGLGIVYLTASNCFWNNKNYTFEMSTPVKLGIGIAF